MFCTDAATADIKWFFLMYSLLPPFIVTGVPHPITDDESDEKVRSTVAKIRFPAPEKGNARRHSRGHVQLFSVCLRMQSWQKEWAHASSVAGSVIGRSHSWHSRHDRMAASASACASVVRDGDGDVRGMATVEVAGAALVGSG